MTGKRRRTETETEEFTAMMRRNLAAMGRRGAKGDLSALSATQSLHAEIDAAMAELVRSLKSEPYCYSWAEIARELGITRQAAQQRWGHLDLDRPRSTGGQPADRR